MKKWFLAAALICLVTGVARVSLALDQPSVYIIKKGDTLWGLSDRFLHDPHYWPDLWARNQSITNPHLIFPGQKLIFRDGKPEVVPQEEPARKSTADLPKAAPAEPVRTVTPPAAKEPEEVAPTRTFTVNGAEGFLLEDELKPTGFIVSTYQNRQIVGEDDVVYTDIGRQQGANVGDRFLIYKKTNSVSHPKTNEILGYRVVPLGVLQISQLEDKVSKAIIVKSYQEISAGSYLLPYKEQKTSVSLKAGTRELTGYIVETQTGNNAIAAGDVVYLDLGRKHGAEPGNLLYVVRDVTPDQKYALDKIEKLPAEVIGALVIVEAGETTSTALVVKSIDTIYRGDRVELKKDR